MALLDTDEVIFKTPHDDEITLTVKGCHTKYYPYEWLPKSVELEVTVLETPETPSCAPAPLVRVVHKIVGSCLVVHYDVPSLTEIKIKVTN